MTPLASVIASAGTGLLLLVGGTAWYFGYQHAMTRERDRNQGQSEVRRIADQKLVEESATSHPRSSDAKTKKQAETLEDARGIIVVRTDPPNALVKVGDAPAQRTPVVIQDLKLGLQILQISMEGYEPAIIRSEVKENQPIQVDVALTRSVGALRIESVPADLKVELKNRADPLNPKLSATPLVIPRIEAGNYDVTVFREGWAIQTKSVTITAAEEQKLSFEFPSGSATLKSDPSGAKVVIDGKEAGLTPLPLTNKVPGEYSYSLSLPGYEKYSGKVAIQQGPENLVCVVNLAKKAAAPKNHPPRTSGKVQHKEEEESPGQRWMRILAPGGIFH